VISQKQGGKIRSELNKKRLGKKKKVKNKEGHSTGPTLPLEGLILKGKSPRKKKPTSRGQKEGTKGKKKKVNRTKNPAGPPN